MILMTQIKTKIINKKTYRRNNKNKNIKLKI